MNLVSNAGIPTLFVRHGRRGTSRTAMLGLARAYLFLTLLAGLVAYPIIVVVTDSPWLAIMAVFLLVFQSLYTGWEYWSLGKGNVAYDKFLRRCGTLQALLSIGAPIGLIMAHSAELGMGLLAISFLAPVAIYRPAHPVSVIKLLVSLETGINRWGRDAASIGLGTIAAAIFYGVDVFILRSSAPAQLVAGYRLGITCVSFVVGLLPISLFLLADVAAGRKTSFRGVFGLAVAGMALTAMIGVAVPYISDRFDVLSVSLLLLSPMVGIRLFTQVLSSELHGRGCHSWVAASFALGLLAWVGIAFVLVAQGADVWSMALLQTLLELVVLLMMVSRYRRQRRFTGGPSLLGEQALLG